MLRSYFKLKKHFIRIVALSAVAAILVISLALFAACNNSSKAKLLFSDEFDGAAVDLAKWGVDGVPVNPGDPGTIRRGGWWTQDSVLIEDGNLVIRTTYDTEKETFYTGSVYSQELFTYGYYEARCKLPEANGIWSAFWVMCEKMNLGDPDATVGGSEIDIFESPYYQFGYGSVQHAIHVGGYGDNHHENASGLPISLGRSEGVQNGYEEWHTFALDWQPDGYKFYIDGELSWQTTDPLGKEGEEGYKANNVSSVPSYIILSVEVGGNGGVPDKDPFFFSSQNPAINNGDMSNFCKDFLVDYVRVWDKNPYA